MDADVARMVGGLLTGTLVGVFAVSAFAKLRDLAEFQGTLRRMRVLPPAWTQTTGVALVLAELAILALLLVPVVRGYGAAAAAGLLAAFTVVLASVIARGIDTSCGCTGPETYGTVGLVHVARNLVLLAAAMGLLLTGPGDVAWVGIVAGVPVGALLLHLNEVVDGLRWVARPNLQE